MSKTKWLIKKIPDCMKPSRKRFNFEEVDLNDSMWKAPVLLPQDKRRIKYAWLVLHDGRLSHSNICDEFISVVEDRFQKIMHTYMNTRPDAKQEANENANAGRENPCLDVCGERLSGGKRSTSLKLYSAGDGLCPRACPAALNFTTGYCQGVVCKECDASGNNENENPQKADPEAGAAGHESVGKHVSIMEEAVKYTPDERLIKEFKSHSMKFLSSIDRFVKLIDDQQVFMELGFQMRNFHGNLSGIQKAYYRVMFRCMEETLVRVMDPKIYRKRIRESMIKFMELVYYNSTFQIDNQALEEDMV